MIPRCTFKKFASVFVFISKCEHFSDIFSVREASKSTFGEKKTLEKIFQFLQKRLILNARLGI